MDNVISFSGGKDSTAMMLMMIDKGIRIDRIICVDTGKEFPAMYEHIDRVREHIKPLKIEVVKLDFDYWMLEHEGPKGKRGWGWPQHNLRWCSGQKTIAFRMTAGREEFLPRTHHYQGGASTKHLIGKRIYIGYSADEPKRAKADKRLNEHYPLIEWGITEQGALKYCLDRGFDWGGLYETRTRVSCFCCPLQTIGSLRDLYRNYPALWAEMRRMDARASNRFHSRYTLDDLEERFNRESKQLKIWS